MDARKKAFAIQAIRRSSYKWYGRNEALKAAKIAYGTYRCAICGNDFRRKDVQLDHIQPVVPTTGWDSFDGYIDRMYCNSEGFQVLCANGKSSCHSMKTLIESAERAETRRANKKKKTIAKRKPKG